MDSGLSIILYISKFPNSVLIKGLSYAVLSSFYFVASISLFYTRLVTSHFLRMYARGLDVVPTTISRFRNGGDNQTAELLENVVYPEEITHCAAGVKWFKYLCLRSRNPNLSDLPSEENSDTVEVDIEVIQKFHSTVRTYFRGAIEASF
ncbi:hypothetical protein K7X08_003188 [Anisodus acutangulus]|uniref:Uncharacterized protein n=1 Tax=Anisodus acutangulus TaxID=402998 RepID=A0A9Q1RFG8_9SOLA|nr:hypothetical protein K7X08_003188 [Anisodus acutangulus]